MKKTVIEYISDTLGEIPSDSLVSNRLRLNAFFSEQETVEKRGNRFVFRYAFYSVEKLRRHTGQSLLKEYNMIRPDLKSIPPVDIPGMECKEVVLYGDVSAPVIRERLAEYLKRNNSPEIQLSFCDKASPERKEGGGNMAYEELQKALFFSKRKKCPLLFVSVRELLPDLRFYDLLEEYHIDFRCLDFPWFCRANLRLIKAVMLYGKLPPAL